MKHVANFQADDIAVTKAMCTSAVLDQTHELPLEPQRIYRSCVSTVKYSNSLQQTDEQEQQ